MPSSSAVPEGETYSQFGQTAAEQLATCHVLLLFAAVVAVTAVFFSVVSVIATIYIQL